MTLLRMAHARPIVPLDDLVKEVAKMRQELGGKGGSTTVPFLKAEKPGAAGSPPRRKKPPPAEPAAPPQEPESEPASLQESKPAVTDENLAARFLEALIEANHGLAALFEDLRLTSQEGNTLVYGVKDEFLLKRLQSMAHEIDPAMEKAGGKGARVMLVKDENGETENTLLKEKRKQDKVHARIVKIRQESREDPVVQWVMDRFEDTEVTVAVKDTEKQ
jgi:hypothetical protein